MGAGGSSAARWSEEITAASPDQLLRSLDGLTGEEREKLSATWNSKLSVFSTSLDGAAETGAAPAAAAACASDDVPLFSFGVITDIQFADRADKLSDPPGQPQRAVRYYRNTLDVVDRAVQWWSRPHAAPPSFVLHAGDIIDQFCAGQGSSQS